MSLNFDIDIDIMQRRRRVYAPKERTADFCIHVFGIAVAAIGIAIMVALARHASVAKLGAVFVYAGGLLLMLGASAAYNFSCDFARPPSLRALLRRCDHSAILLMIAATFTPFAMNWTGGPVAFAATGGIWLAVAGAIAFKWLAPSLFERWSVVLFLALAWLAGSLMWSLGAQLPPASLTALFIGGALYTIGIAFHLWDSLPFQNAIWHGFVLAAAICHYFSILEGVVLPPGLT